MSGPAEPTGLCANHGVTEASGKVSHARHNIVEVGTGGHLCRVSMLL
jgi:hypothetical protein